MVCANAIWSSVLAGLVALSSVPLLSAAYPILIMAGKVLSGGDKIKKALEDIARKIGGGAVSHLNGGRD